MVALCQKAAFVAIPTGVSLLDIESVVPWMDLLGQRNVRAAFVLNKANRRTRSFVVARETLLKHGNLCPVEIPLLEDLHSPLSDGLATLDFDNARGAGPIEAVWRYVSREAGL